MSHRLSIAIAAALVGVAAFAAPASAVMQVIQLPDPTAAGQNSSAPDGLFDKSFSDHWQSNSTDAQPGMGKFHFTVNGAAGGYTSAGTQSAVDAAKQPGSEFYQPVQGSSFPYYNGH